MVADSHRESETTRGASCPPSQCGGTELNRRLRVGMASGCRYPTAAIPHVGSEGVEPSPQRLKGAYAAVTPRPWFSKRLTQRRQGAKWQRKKQFRMSLPHHTMTPISFFASW